MGIEFEIDSLEDMCSLMCDNTLPKRKGRKTMKTSTTKIVIELDDELYNDIFADREKFIAISGMRSGKTLFATLMRAIGNGKVLPKGHGRLIDADALEYTCNSDECGMLTGCNNCQYHIITEWELDRAKTIIEADKEGAEE